MASSATAALIRSLRGGRTAVQEGLQSFNTDSTTMLQDLLRRQGLGGSQGAGLTTALGQQLGQQAQYGALDTSRAEIAQNQLQSADELGTAALERETGLGLQQIYQRGADAESQLRFLIARMQKNRQTQNLLERIGASAGLGASVGSFGGPIGTGVGAVVGGVGGALSSLL